MALQAPCIALVPDPASTLLDHMQQTSTTDLPQLQLWSDEPLAGQLYVRQSVLTLSYFTMLRAQSHGPAYVPCGLACNLTCTWKLLQMLAVTDVAVTDPPSGRCVTVHVSHLDCIKRETCEDVGSTGDASTQSVHCAFRNA